MTQRTLTISISYDPSISGFGGYDEYQLGPLTPEQIDYFNERLTKLVEGCAKTFKCEGGWTGQS